MHPVYSPTDLELDILLNTRTKKIIKDDLIIEEVNVRKAKHRENSKTHL